jgi:hypothetical protein
VEAVVVELRCRGGEGEKESAAALEGERGPRVRERGGAASF